MSDDTTKGEAVEPLVAHLLAHNAAHYRYGLLAYARPALAISGKEQNEEERVRQMLGNLAHAVANSRPLTSAEQLFHHQLLLALAEGRDVRKELGINPPKTGHRKANPSKDMDLMQMVDRLEVVMVDGGVPLRTAKTAALKRTAEIVRMKVDAVSKAVDRCRRAEKDIQKRMRAIEVDLLKPKK